MLWRRGVGLVRWQLSVEVNEEINHHDEMSQNMRHNRCFWAFHKCRCYFIKSELIQNGYWSLFFSMKLDNGNHWFAEPRLYFQSTKILTPDFLRWLWESKRKALFNYENMIFPILCSYFCLNYLRQKVFGVGVLQYCKYTFSDGGRDGSTPLCFIQIMQWFLFHIFLMFTYIDSNSMMAR